MKTRNETDMNEQRENGKIGGLAESLVIAFSMYSRIPMPMVACYVRVEFQEKLQ